MKKELNFIENGNGFTASLKSNGINFTAGFFILFFVLVLGFVLYALVEIYPSPGLSINGNNVFLASMLLVGFISLIFLIIVVNLVGQSQQIVLLDNQLTIIKKNPLWFRTRKTITRSQIERIKREKLIFSVKNIWYAFLFHDHTAFHIDAEKYLVPHIFNSNLSLAFFEFAEENNKDFIVEQIRKRLD